MRTIMFASASASDTYERLWASPSLTLTPNTRVLFDSPMNINNRLHMLRFNPRHLQTVAIYTFELLILRSQCQPTLEMRARVGLGNLP